MKIINISPLETDSKGNYFFKMSIGNGVGSKTLTFSTQIDSFQYRKQMDTPIRCDECLQNFYVFHNKVVKINGIEEVDQEELLIRIQHFILNQEKQFNKMKKEIDAFNRMEKAKKSKREPIPEEIKLFVWQRDQGKCIQCGSNEKLEFDHIIPFAMGGSNTERNLQLLCENCNRKKGKNI